MNTKQFHYSMLNSHYNNINDYLKKKYGRKIFKVCVDGNFTCPNRDGTKGLGGCIFCNNRGSGEHINNSISISQQVTCGIDKVIKKRHANSFIVYFQNFTATYDSIDMLRKKYLEATEDSRVVILSIATRPDCINNAIIDLLKEIQAIRHIDIWIELGLQTIHSSTAKRINRCYDTIEFYNAVNLINNAGFDIIVHIMFGLPNETSHDMLQTVQAISCLNIQGVKFHCTTVLKETYLEKLYKTNRYSPLNLIEYIDILTESIKILPPKIVVHRLISDSIGENILAPIWTSNKLLMLNSIAKKFEIDNIKQGQEYTRKRVL